MQQNRIWIAATVGWLFLFFNVERIHEPLNLASFVYVLAACAGIVMLLMRPARQLPLYRSLPVALAAHLVVKCLLGYEIGASNLPVTLCESAAIAVTVWLTANIGRGTDRFAEATNQLLLMHRPRRVPGRHEAEPAFQREVRRARRYERPLSLITLRPTAESLDASLGSFVRQLEAELIERYAVGCLADLLTTETKANDLVAGDGAEFVLLLPETDRANAERMAARLRARCGEKLGLAIDVGVANFPQDELTFSGLLARTKDTASEPASVVDDRDHLHAAELLQTA